MALPVNTCRVDGCVVSTSRVDGYYCILPTLGPSNLSYLWLVYRLLSYNPASSFGITSTEKNNRRQRGEGWVDSRHSLIGTAVRVCSPCLMTRLHQRNNARNKMRATRNLLRATSIMLRAASCLLPATSCVFPATSCVLRATCCFKQQVVRILLRATCCAGVNAA